MTLVKLRYNSKLVPDPGLVLQTPLCFSRPPKNSSNEIRNYSKENHYELENRGTAVDCTVSASLNDCIEM